MQVVDWISKQAGKIADNFQNYKFYVKSTPQTIDSSTKLYLNTFTSREEQAIVPCLYKWSRLKNGIVSQVNEFKGNTFICEPSDVGCELQVQITSTDQQHPGTALLKYGPVEIDVLLKQTIQGALSTGQAKFQADVFHEDRIKQCTLTITDDYIRINQSSNPSSNFRFNYCLGQPLVNALTKDPTNISIVFPQKYQSETLKFLLELWNDLSLSNQQKSKQELIMNLRFVNRRQKDQFLFVMKGFIAKKELKHSAAINKIEKMEIDQSNIHFMLEIQSLRKDLLRLFNINKKSQEQKKIYFEETLKLQQEIEDIISSYTKLIEGKFKTKQQFQESFVDFQNKKDQAVTHKYKRIQDQNLRLRQYIREKLDADFKDEDLLTYNNIEARTDNLNPFIKKKEPFAEIGNKNSPLQYQNILNNLEGQEELLLDDTKNFQKIKAEKDKLEQKLNRSMVKIQKLEGQLDRMNRSAFVGSNNQSNLSMSRHNASALEVSASKVVEEKFMIERKYAKLKEDYAKLKTIYETQKNTYLTQNQEGMNPEFKLRNVLNAMEEQKNLWKGKAEALEAELKKTKEEHEKIKLKLQKKIFDLNEQVTLSRKNTDVLNRSQHLSMEMDEYNQQQGQILKEQNTFLMNQNERLTKMCEKYKSEYKKMKEGLKNGSMLL